MEVDTSNLARAKSKLTEALYDMPLTMEERTAIKELADGMARAALATVIETNTLLTNEIFK